jgi:Late exocytosis, associated with Golgi transport/Cytosolic domain of 10TM putative phosphate transporter
MSELSPLLLQEHDSSHSVFSRLLFWNSTFWNNFTAMDKQNITDFDSNLVKAQDVTVDAVLTSLYFNAVVFVLLMCFYECLRRMLPAVYSSRKRLHIAGSAVHHRNNNDPHHTVKPNQLPARYSKNAQQQQQLAQTPQSGAADSTDTATTTTDDDGNDVLQQSSSENSSLPDERPLDWIGPVFGVPWSKVRQTAGLDGYFFLRYIRMNVRITAVSTFWFFLILVPLYATGTEVTDLSGWYRLTAANLPANGKRMWVPCVFLYLFTGFIFFVVQQEYKHFLEVRQDFLAKGTIHVHPQHHYAVMVENIPYELRSDRALADYFGKLFPDAVHSAVVVLKLPDLAEANMRCMRSCRRLEKSIAYLHATGHRPTHIVGRGRVNVLGIDLAPLECTQPCSSSDEEDNNADSYYSSYSEMANDDPHPQLERPARGTRVDSIAYYTQELAAHSRALFRMQQRKASIAVSGNQSERITADNWLGRVVQEANLVAAQIMDDSVVENALVTPVDNYYDDSKGTVGVPAENTTTSRYGSIGSPVTTIGEDPLTTMDQKKARFLDDRPSVRACAVVRVCDWWDRSVVDYLLTMQPLVLVAV